jgi:hypothetical protein
MKCWRSQGSRLIIVIVQLGAVKIYVAAVWSVEEKGKIRWNSIYHQNRWFSEFHPPLNANVLFCRFLKNLTLCMTKLRVLVLSFSYFTENSTIRNRISIQPKRSRVMERRVLPFFLYLMNKSKLCVVLRRSPASFNAQDISCGFCVLWSSIALQLLLKRSCRLSSTLCWLHISFVFVVPIHTCSLLPQPPLRPQHSLLDLLSVLA